MPAQRKLVQPADLWGRRNIVSFASSAICKVIEAATIESQDTLGAWCISCMEKLLALKD